MLTNPTLFQCVTVFSVFTWFFMVVNCMGTNWGQLDPDKHSRRIQSSGIYMFFPLPSSLNQYKTRSCEINTEEEDKCRHLLRCPLLLVDQGDVYRLLRDQQNTRDGASQSVRNILDDFSFIYGHDLRRKGTRESEGRLGCRGDRYLAKHVPSWHKSAVGFLALRGCCSWMWDFGRWPGAQKV